MNKTLLSFCVIIITSAFIVDAEVFGDKPKKTDLATLSIQPEFPSAKDTDEAFKHVIVYKESGRFCGWPATHGIWNWGNEILVGFRLNRLDNYRRNHSTSQKKLKTPNS